MWIHSKKGIIFTYFPLFNNAVLSMHLTTAVNIRMCRRHPPNVVQNSDSFAVVSKRKY